MISFLKVRKAGVYGSIQDQGRFGFRRFGVPVSGPMDAFAFKMGNYIIGNPPGSPVLELFLGGQEFEVLTDHRIVITGADLGAQVDGQAAPMWKTFSVNQGQTLRFTNPKKGSIAYLIPEGGFASEVQLGSASAYPRGLLGSSLKKDAVLIAKKAKTDCFHRGLISSEIPDYANEVEVRVWPSPHGELFVSESLEEFFQSTYIVRSGDRMGYLLQGPTLKFKNGSDILSEATQFGTIQVPNSGQPIILMADAQTIGGYATIGKIATKDLWKIAQLRAGGKVRFKCEQ